MDDQTLIRLLRQDPDAGLRVAMQSYAPLVKAVIGRILPRDPREAEEAVADVFVALWRQAPALARENTPLRPWLAVTARNAGIDRYRAQALRQGIPAVDCTGRRLRGGLCHRAQRAEPRRAGPGRRAAAHWGRVRLGQPGHEHPAAQ